MIESSRIATVVSAFIEDSADRARFDGFFELAFHFARGFLAQRLRRGYRLPLEQYSSQTGLNDCTIDCLATLFASRPGNPFHLILDYFAAKVHSKSTPEDIAGLFGGLIAGHMRQELYRIQNTNDPQQANLKRRIRDIMGGDEYGQFEEGDTRYWVWKHATHSAREDRPIIDDASLGGHTLKAIQAHSLMPDRCREVFAELDQDSRFRNAIPAHQFTISMVKVLTGFEDWEPQSQRAPDQQYVHEQISRLAESATRLTTDHVLIPLSDKRGFTAAEKRSFVDALQDLFRDFSTDGDHDVLPRYVKERLTTAGIEWDLKRHKYIWETVVTDCKDRLREMLRDKGLNPSAD
jgi:hypothetical protein